MLASRLVSQSSRNTTRNLPHLHSFNGKWESKTQKHISSYLFKNGTSKTTTSRYIQQREIFSPLLQRRDIFSFLRFKLKRLETEANEKPSDPNAQAAYMKELNKYNPQEVQKRFDSGRYAINDEVQKEYIRALVLLKQFDQFKLPEFIKAFYPHLVSAGLYHPPTTDSSSPTSDDASSTQQTTNNTTSNTTAGATPNNTNNTQQQPGGVYSPSYHPFGTGHPISVELIPSAREKRRWAVIKLLGVLAAVLGLTYFFLGNPASEEKMALPFQISNAHSQVQNVDVKFDDVKGCDEAKDELKEVVEYLKNPKKFAKLGARLPKGVLLVGVPGTGKTLLARAIAGEAGVPFLYSSGSSFDEMFVGVGPRRMRNLFDDAKKLAPCIVFIDEIDAIGTSRKRSISSSYAKENTLNQLLTELDGFKQTQGIIIIGATNLPEALDPALVRPGRFDKQIVVPVPDIKGRKEIIDMYLKKTVIGNDVNSLVIARGTPGFTGADLANLINIAAIKATIADKSHVNMKDLEEAKDDVIMGIKRRGNTENKLSRKITAYHEGGHALVALYTEGSVPLHKATIIQRGSALGMTVQLPETDVESVSKKEMYAKLACMMGGRAAEEVIFGADEITSGASSDFKQATRLAYNMVARWGMSENIGAVYHDELEKMSDQQKMMIDAEVKAVLQKSYDTAKTLLTTHKEELHRVAKALLEVETLSGEEIKKVAEGGKVERNL